MPLKTPSEIEKIERAGKILAMVAKEILKAVKVGARLKDLDSFAKELILKAGGQPAFLGYRPFGARKPYPYSICASVNEVVVHGLPDFYKLKSGDLLKLDFGVIYDGYYADAAWTVGIGKISAQAKKLIEVTENALYAAIKQVKPGKTLGDIGCAINNYVIKRGFKVIKNLTGHGIGKKLHEDFDIPNEGQKGSGLNLEPGMVLAIEPMVSAGSPDILHQPDDSFVTADGSLSAHFEHTVAITEKGAKILTRL